MIESVKTRDLTLDEFMALPGHYEVIDGVLMERYEADPMTGRRMLFVSSARWS